jgi:methyl-accepting chemotaxis protein
MQEQLTDGSRIVSATIETVEGVMSQVVSVNKGIQEVDNATGEQARTAEEVVGLIDDISNVADRSSRELASRIKAAIGGQRDGRVRGVVQRTGHFRRW